MPLNVTSKFAFWISGIYLAFGLAAWTLPLIAKPGESLAGIFVVPLAMPWSLVLSWVMDRTGIDSMLFNMVFLLIGLLLNTVILYYLISWVTGKWR